MPDLPKPAPCRCGGDAALFLCRNQAGRRWFQAYCKNQECLRMLDGGFGESAESVLAAWSRINEVARPPASQPARAWLKEHDDEAET